MGPIARLVAASSLLVPAGARAQRVLSSVDISQTTIRYADSVNATGASISPAFRVDWSRATLAASVDISALAGKASMQGTIAPSVFTPRLGGVFAELAGSFGGSTHEDGTHTGQMLAIGRGYYAPVANVGVWIGAGSGQTWDGVAWRGITQGEIGAWIDRSRLTTLVTVTPVRVSDSIRYSDLEVALRYPGTSFEIGGSIGARAGSSGLVPGENQRAWGMVSATRWLSRRIAIVASAGSYPVDLTQGFPGGRFAAIAFRIASPNTRRVTEPAPSINQSSTSASGADSPAASFEVRTTAGNRRVIRMNAPNASRVEISGDFTQWQPVSLARGADGRWSVTQSIPRGTYQVTIRIDGGAWVAPPGLLASRDELGAIVGILTIE